MCLHFLAHLRVHEPLIDSASRRRSIISISWKSFATHSWCSRATQSLGGDSGNISISCFISAPPVTAAIRHTHWPVQQNAERASSASAGSLLNALRTLCSLSLPSPSLLNRQQPLQKFDPVSKPKRASIISNSWETLALNAQQVQQFNPLARWIQRVPGRASA